MGNPALPPNWRHRAACRDDDPATPALFDVESGPAAEPARQICARCRVRGACLADDLRANEDAPAGIRAGLDADVREDLFRCHGEYLTEVAEWHKGVLYLAGRREARGDEPGALAARQLAAASAQYADAVTGYALALAASVPPAELTLAEETHADTLAALTDASTEAALAAESGPAAQARKRLMDAARPVSALSCTFASITTPAPVSPGSPLAGAA